MEQIPRPLAYPHKLGALRLLRLGAVAALAKRPPPLRGPAVAQRRAGALLVLGPSSLALAVGVGGGLWAAVVVVGPGGRRRRGLGPAVVDDLGEPVGSAAGEVSLGFLGGLVLPRSAGRGYLLGVL